MQLGDGNNTTSPRAAVAIVILLLVAFACLAGCSTTGGSLRTTRFLFVSDGGNNRVLIYNALFSSDQSANVVLGQSSLTGSASGSSAAEMNSPAAATVDGAGNLYVADSGNCRVLQFMPPFTTGMSATLASVSYTHLTLPTNREV